MLDMIVASASLVLAAASMPALTPVAAVPAIAVSTTATALAVQASGKDAMPAAKVAPVDAIVEVQLSKGAFLVRHEDGGVEYRPHPTTGMKLGLVSDKVTVCDSTGAYLQASENGRCALTSRSPDISGKFAVRHVEGTTYELHYAGKSVSSQLRPHEAVTFDIEGVNVGVMLYRLSDAEATAG